MINNDKKLFLVDAYPFIYKSFYTYKKNPLITSNGLDTSSIIGFTYFLLNILNEESPNYMGVFFDCNKENFRKKKYKKYKSHRKITPTKIVNSIPYIKKILKAFKIVYFNSNGYEADDLIGTIAKKAEKKGFKIYIITLDKDFLQLVTKNIKIYNPSKGYYKKILDKNYIKKKFEINNPKQIIDLWSMMGDPTDNIPGLPGIGEKNAKKFIKKYGNIENFLNYTNELNGKIKENVEKNKYMGILSKKLLTIVTDIPYFNFIENNFFIKKPDLYYIKNIFKELEFKKLLKKVYKYYNKYNN